MCGFQALSLWSLVMAGAKDDCRFREKILFCLDDRAGQRFGRFVNR